jgi:hypothetical protein
MDDGESSGFSTTAVGFLDTNVALVLQSASGALQLRDSAPKKEIPV